jgi:hypothetical protein
VDGAAGQGVESGFRHRRGGRLGHVGVAG